MFLFVNIIKTAMYVYQKKPSPKKPTIGIHLKHFYND